jgi:carbamoyl-phosphate synthase large subunit
MKALAINSKKILLLGSGGLKIGQAGEFDYSGTQAIKALKEEGYEIILVNPNIATVQTDKGMANKVYFLPVEMEFVEEVIKKERPFGILLSFGGQTALNCGLELEEKGILKKYQVAVLGTPVKSIRQTEDRDLFAKELGKISVKIPKSAAANSPKEAILLAKKIGYPLIIRAAFCLGGRGSGFAKDESELKTIIKKAFSYSSQVLLEESLKGWKEIEYEVVRDCFSNSVCVCNMENFDPLGIHTGESIVVAPSQTLNNREYQLLRSLSLKIACHFKIVGECNVQFALDPESSDYRVIELNARLSRSSALASKATGYPLAYVAAKLALGANLSRLKNAITKKTTACFEPALDYIVLKFPRWDLNKFRKVSQAIGSEMKSVGEVMAIGVNFEEALQKAIRMLQIGSYGFTDWSFEFKDLEKEIKEPTPRRIFAIAAALEKGWTTAEIAKLSQIDLWFLEKLKNIVLKREAVKNLEQLISTKAISIPADYPSKKPKEKSQVLTITGIKEIEKFKEVLLSAKKIGFSDAQIGWYLGVNEKEIRARRKELKIVPFVRQIDTLAGEFPAETNHLYLTYNGQEHDISFSSANNKVVVLGSGPYCIGSSVEFDWCCVNTSRELKRSGKEVIMINYNPETVSTDYDECDRLYFEELSEERVLDICDLENPQGVVVSMGGQIPNNLALPLSRQGIPILGTDPTDIDRAEDRYLFSSLLDRLKISQPLWKEFTQEKSALDFAERVDYPVLVRPSYVLSGQAMSVAYNSEHLKNYLFRATQISSDHPVVVSKFEMGAKEIEVDAVAHNGKIIVYAISEHVENAGVHSGDATIVLPPQRLYLETIRRIKKIARDIAKELKITGPFNLQFLAKSNDLKVIECNLRASRSFPFSSKITGINFIRLAVHAFMGKVIKKKYNTLDLDYVGVKAPQFSFERLAGADPVLGVEMASTGEVATLGDSLEEAFLKALAASGFRAPKKTILLSIGPLEAKLDFLASAKKLELLGFKLYATNKTARFLKRRKVSVSSLKLPSSTGKAEFFSFLGRYGIELIVNIPNCLNREDFSQGYYLRRAAIDANVPLIGNLQSAKLLVRSLEKGVKLKSKSYQEYLND